MNAITTTGRRRALDTDRRAARLPGSPAGRSAMPRRMSLWCGLVLMAMAALAPVASAESFDEILRTYYGSAGPPSGQMPIGGVGSVGAPTGGGPGVALGGGGSPLTPPSGGGTAGRLNGTSCVRAGGVRTCDTYRAARLVTRCVARGGRKVCTTFGPRGRAVRRCTTRPGARMRCVAVRRGAAPRSFSRAEHTAPAAGQAQSLALGRGLGWHGWPGQTSPAVGKITFPKPNGMTGACTGTVVSRTLVLTAGHCLWDNGAYYGNPADCQSAARNCVLFMPGMTWSDPNVSDSISAPYGVWRAARYWVTSGWAGSGDQAQDWGLIEFGPDAQGRYIGDVVGSWNITTDLSWADGSRVFIMGYPVMGFWSGAAGRNGRGQYACDVSIDTGDWRTVSTGWELYAPCYMNGGASGGPWFVQKTDGSWTIGAVSNRCWSATNMSPAAYCQPYSDYLRASYLDSRFLAFWNAIQPQLAVR